MRRRLWLSAATAVAIAVAAPGVANADVVLGSAAPVGSPASNACGGLIVAQFKSDPATPYAVPAGGGQITQWQTNTSGATLGDPLTFVVLRPTGGNNYTVVGVDSRTIPGSAPGGVATFTLASPITVAGGDTLALWAPSGSSAVCYFNGGRTFSLDATIMLDSSSTPTPGQGVSVDGTGSPPGYQVNVAATLVQAQDAGLTTSTAPAKPTAGSLALLSSTVTNGGPAPGPIAFTDQVPRGLAIDSVIAGGSSTCSVRGQTVSCTISGLAAGQSVPVAVVVTPRAAGSYRNSVSVVASTPDPNPANNAASATLRVAGSGPTKCIVPNLRGVKASLAKRLLKLLGCKVGKVRRVHDRHVRKGNVVRTTPRPGTYAAGKVVGIQVSSGPRRARHHR
jgi:hypothetical protein